MMTGKRRWTNERDYYAMFRVLEGPEKEDLRDLVDTGPEPKQLNLGVMKAVMATATQRHSKSMWMLAHNWPIEVKITNLRRKNPDVSFAEAILRHQIQIELIGELAEDVNTRNIDWLVPEETGYVYFPRGTEVEINYCLRDMGLWGSMTLKDERPSLTYLGSDYWLRTIAARTQMSHKIIYEMICRTDAVWYELIYRQFSALEAQLLRVEHETADPHAVTRCFLGRNGVMGDRDRWEVCGDLIGIVQAELRNSCHLARQRRILHKLADIAEQYFPSEKLAWGMTNEPHETEMLLSFYGQVVSQLAP